MNLDFTFSGNLDPVASYAALLSTAIAVWEFLKWRGRNCVEVDCMPNMNILQETHRDKKKYIRVDVTNKGQYATTITHLWGWHGTTFLAKFFSKKQKRFLVLKQQLTQNLPKVLQPGEQWMGLINQDDELEQHAREGFLYVGVGHSMGKKGVLRRVIIKDAVNKVTAA